MKNNDSKLKETPTNSKTKKKKSSKKRLPVVGIGASAGGLEAFKKLFSLIPAKTGMAYVLITHLDPKHKSSISELISNCSNIPVNEAENKQKIKSDNAYVIPPNCQLSIKDDTLHLTDIDDNQSIRLPVNHFFESLAEDKNEFALGIILSGTGSDGTQGINSIKHHGGLAIAQSPETAQFSSMPENAEKTGVLDFVLPLEEMPEMLIHYSKHILETEKNLKYTNIDSSDMLNSILSIIQKQIGYNFHYYKKATLQRRIERRMGLVNKFDSKEYVDFLKKNNSEVKALFKDLLIGVTSFFREPEVWDQLKKYISEVLLKKKQQTKSLRIWVPGCATGEEAYTIAMSVMEILEKEEEQFDLQIFATDINENALSFARTGLYSANSVENLTKDQLKKFFTKVENGYCINQDLRDSVIFSVQNLISDPPFSKLDIISCRNLLIYLDSEIQKKIINLFHFALNEGGILLLGNSETIGQQEDIFEVLSKPFRIFKCIGSKRLNKIDFPILRKNISPDELKKKSELDNNIKIRAQDLANLTQRMLIKKNDIAGVLINRKKEVLYLSGDTSPYILQHEGAFSQDLFSMVREGIQNRLRRAVSKVLKSNESILDIKSRVKRDDSYYPVLISVFPLEKEIGGNGFILISFKDAPDTSDIKTSVGEEDESVVTQLENELKMTREELQQTIEDMELSSEDLKLSNEEIMSMNEELQSSNEELETSKEELQSLNEELSTVNAQLQDNIIDLEQLNNDLTNLMKITDMGILFLDEDLKIRRFTPSAQKLFRVINQDIGRSFKDISIQIDDDSLYYDIQNVIEKQQARYNEVQSKDGTWYRRKALPYKIDGKKTKGVVIVYDDITNLKEKNAALRESEHQKRRMLDGLMESVMLVDQYFKVEWANQAVTKRLGKTAEEIQGTNCHEALRHKKNPCMGDCPTTKAFKTGKPHSAELKVGNRIYQINSNPIFDEKGNVISVIEASMDITLIKNAQQELERKVRERTRELQKANESLQEAKKDIEEREERFRNTFEQAAVGIAHVSPDGQWLRVNHKLCDILGYGKKELLKMSFMDITYQGDLKEDEELAASVLNGNLKTYNVEKRYICKNGSLKWVNLTVSLVRQTDGTPKHFISVIQDISKRKKIEEEVLNLARFPSENPNPVLRITEKGIIIYANDASKDLLDSWQVQEGRKLPEGKLKWIKQTVNSKKPVIAEEGSANRIYSLCFTKVEGTGFINVYGLDITESKRTEEELNRIQELENIGRLAGGIAHDFNNLMTGVFGNLSFAKVQVDRNHPAYPSLLGAEKAMKRATALTHQLLTFAKGGEPVKTVIDLPSIFKETVSFDLSGSNIKPCFEFSDDIWQIEADQGQLQQVISNLIINARDAMPKGGHIYIRMTNTELGKGAKANLPSGKYVKIVIEDEGPGIDKETMRKIFNPYYTTKKMGNGLGLAIVNSIIIKHQGHISVYSEKEHGTSFTIYLPAETKLKTNKNIKDRTGLFEDKNKSYRILLMDDEEMILELVPKILKDYNFDIDTAKNGTVAITKYKKAIDSGKPFDVVILDLTIPGGKGGADIIKELKKIDSDVKAIVSSGYANDSVLANYEKYGFKAIATKPYTTQELLESIYQTINSN